MESQVLSNGDLKAMTRKLQIVSNGDVHHPKAVPQEEVKSAERKPVNIAEMEEFDDEEESRDKAWQYAAEIPTTQIDDRDKGTSDDWIPRHPDLVRLTGRHPFNCEPPLSALVEVHHPFSPYNFQSPNLL